MFNSSPLWCDLILFSNYFFFHCHTPTGTQFIDRLNSGVWRGEHKMRRVVSKEGSNRQNLTASVGYVVSAIDAVHTRHMERLGERAIERKENMLLDHLPFTDALR